MANEAILKYLVDTNRPYSCTDVTTNLRGAYSKTIVQRSLDSLAESGKIKCKVYGKQKVYCAIQPDYKTDNKDESTEELENHIKNLTSKLNDKMASLKSAEATLKSLTSQPTNKEALATIEELSTKVAEMEKRLAKIKESTDLVSSEEREKITKDHATNVKEFRKRKRICTDIMDAILEGYPKSKKTFIEELGLETDEEAGFKLNC